MELCLFILNDEFIYLFSQIIFIAQLLFVYLNFT